MLAAVLMGVNATIPPRAQLSPDSIFCRWLSWLEMCHPSPSPPSDQPDNGLAGHGRAGEPIVPLPVTEIPVPVVMPVFTEPTATAPIAIDTPVVHPSADPVVVESEPAEIVVDPLPTAPIIEVFPTTQETAPSPSPKPETVYTPETPVPAQPTCALCATFHSIVECRAPCTMKDFVTRSIIAPTIRQCVPDPESCPGTENFRPPSQPQPETFCRAGMRFASYYEDESLASSTDDFGACAADAEYLYCAKPGIVGDPGRHTNIVLKIRASDMREESRGAMDGDGIGPAASAAIDRARGIGYFLVTYPTASIVQVDLGTMIETGRLTLEGLDGWNAYASIVADGDGRLYVGLHGSIVKIDTMREVARRELSFNVNALAVDSTDGMLYAATDGGAEKMDTATLESVGSLPLQRFLGAHIFPGSRYAYFTDPSQVVRVSTSDFAVVNAVDLTASLNRAIDGSVLDAGAGALRLYQNGNAATVTSLPLDIFGFAGTITLPIDKAFDGFTSPGRIVAAASDDNGRSYFATAPLQREGTSKVVRIDDDPSCLR